MKPGEVIVGNEPIILNAELEPITFCVANTGDRPIQVASHFHFFETNLALEFDREKARGMRLDVAAGTSIRFEPGQRRDVTLIPFKGKQRMIGFRGAVMGNL